MPTMAKRKLPPSGSSKTLLYSAGFFRKPFPAFRLLAGVRWGCPGGQYPPLVWLLGFALKNLTNLTGTSYKTPQTLMAQYKAEILAGKHRKHKILCKIQILQQDTTRYSIFFCFGKDEVGGSNPPSSSTGTLEPQRFEGSYFYRFCWKIALFSVTAPGHSGAVLFYAFFRNCYPQFMNCLRRNDMLFL